MKTIHQIFANLMVAAVLLVMITGCEFDNPATAWDELNNRENITPEITKVLPEDAGAVSEITLIGKNFSTSAVDNWVYFDKTRCLIKSCTDTAIVVFRPNVVGDSVNIKVSVTNAWVVAKYAKPYKMDPVVENFGIFTGDEALIVGTVDRNDNIYMTMDDRSMIKILPDGSRDMSFNVETSGNLWTDIKIYNDQFYMTRTRRNVYRIPVAGGELEDWADFADKEKVKYFDINENGDLYGGGNKTGIVLLHQDMNSVKVDDYFEDFNVNAVRIYSGYLYIAANYAKFDSASIEVLEGIWKFPIQGDGSLGARINVIDWTTTEYAASEILCMDISADGILYLGTDNETSSPILIFNEVLHNFTPMFYGLLTPPIEQIFWGNSTYFYAVKNKRLPFESEDGTSPEGAFLKINTGVAGAPYYGR